MADYTAIAAATSTLRTLLLDRMTMSAPVTLVPPDVTPAGIDTRVNLYLVHVHESPELKNQEIPGAGSPGAYGKPPLSLNLRYLLTSYPALETQPTSDLNAQFLLGDAMRVLHEFGNKIDGLAITKAAAGNIGDPILDPVLINEYERLKITLHPATLDDMAKIWSALSEANFRRSVLYDLTVVQIETKEAPVKPQPVRKRRLMMSVKRAPSIAAAYVTPTNTQPAGETRVRVDDEITILADHALADKLYVKLGGLDPIRVTPPGDGRVRIVIPDAVYPVDLDHGATRPIPAASQLQPGVLTVQLIAQYATEGVEGGLDHGSAIAATRNYWSNVVLLQLVPKIDSVTPSSGDATKILHITGKRLWHAQARFAYVTVGNAPIVIRPGGGWAAPTPTVVEVPVADAAAVLPVQAGPDPPYTVAVEIDGARSRDAVGYHLDP
jgi:Pvc16 N-terminal domain